MASNAAKLDADGKDKDKVQRVQRYSKEYFDLVRANTLEENRILASQAPQERLLIELRGQAYMIE